MPSLCFREAEPARKFYSGTFCGRSMITFWSEPGVIKGIGDCDDWSLGFKNVAPSDSLYLTFGVKDDS
jgi:hypothetical protein